MTPVAGFESLSASQRALLKRGNVESLDTLVLTPPSDLARRCKSSILEVQTILEKVCSANRHEVLTVEQVQAQVGRPEIFTTGDPTLDAGLGGGVRVGMVWEIAGESAAGKTQLALQLSLSVQLPYENGGLAGSACYITTSAVLPTSRLVQIAEAHPHLAAEACTLSNVHTMSTPTIPALIYVLKSILPNFISQRSTGPNPVKLLVIDSLAELFHSSDKTTTATLVERSRSISEVSSFLHSLASGSRLAVVVINEVVDSFNRSSSQAIEPDAELVYVELSRWFSRAHSIPQETFKEASLGLVWANQINARILLTRSGRRRHLNDDETRSLKGKRITNYSTPTPTDAQLMDQPTLIRRLSVVFSCVGAPISLDYIITIAGFHVLPEEETSFTQFTSIQSPSDCAVPPVPQDSRTQLPTKAEQAAPSQISPLDVGFAEDVSNSGQEAGGGPNEDVEDDDEYWKDDTIPEHLFHDLDLPVLDSKSTEEIIPSSQDEDDILTYRDCAY